MSDWSSGYVADIGYTHGCYRELNPIRSELAFLNAGVTPPQLGTHCELGFGQGLSINIHAAASGATWYGNDFNPAQAAFAQSLAFASGSEAHLTDEAFLDFCNRSDLPEFDSIGLHGIWSWISDENRAVIVDFIRRKLKLGGVVYVSYNTQPGWASFAPIRHLMAEHASVMGSVGIGVVNRVDNAMDFVAKVLNSNPRFAKANPSVVERFNKLKEKDRPYLAHEYFNKDWHPMHFATMNQWLSPAKLDFACSAHYLDHMDAVCILPEQQALLKEIPDSIFRQTVRDFMVNQQFRRDYWVKGARLLSPFDRVQQLKRHRVVLTNFVSDVPLKSSGPLGEVNLSESIYKPILQALSNYQAANLEEIYARVKENGINFAQLVQAIMVLINDGHVASVANAEPLGKAKTASKKLNQVLIEKAQSSTDVAFLASPVTGGGIPVNRFQQLFLLAISRGQKQPKEWAISAWAVLSSQGQKIVKDGIAIESAEDSLAELNQMAEEFSVKRLPILKALQIA
jgi:SAM-dependent methyltransferase